MEVIVEELERRSLFLEISKVVCIVLTVASCSKNYIRMGFPESYLNKRTQESIES